MYSTTMSMIDTDKHNMPCQAQIFLTDRRHINDSGRVRSLHRYRPGPCPALRRGPPSLLSPVSLCLSLSLSFPPDGQWTDMSLRRPPPRPAPASRGPTFLSLSLLECLISFPLFACQNCHPLSLSLPLLSSKPPPPLSIGHPSALSFASRKHCAKFRSAFREMGNLAVWYCGFAGVGRCHFGHQSVLSVVGCSYGSAPSFCRTFSGHSSCSIFLPEMKCTARLSCWSR